MTPKGFAAAMLAALLALAPCAAAAQTPPPLPPPTPPPLPQPAVQYFYDDNGKPAGPVPLAEIQAKIAAGIIKPDTLVWKAGLPNWVAAKDLAEIAPLFAGGAPTAAPVVSDCKGKVLLSDDFKQVDDSWKVAPEKATVEDHKLKVKADPGGFYGFSYGGRKFGEADYCVTVQSPNNLKDVNSPDLLAGLLFWAQDDNNAFALMVAPNGGAALARAVNGKWSTPVAFHPVDAVKKGSGTKNMLRVSTSGDSIIAYINGQKFASVRAQAPEGGGEVGFWAQSEKSSRDSWKFLDLVVTAHGQ